MAELLDVNQATTRSTHQITPAPTRWWN